MVKKNKERATRSGKNNSLKIGLFVVLVLALVFIGRYQYMTSVANLSQLKGKLPSYYPIYPGDPEAGPGEWECTSHQDCGAEQSGLNFPNDWVYSTCRKCDFDTHKCVWASETDMCGLNNAYLPNKQCDGEHLQEVVYKVYCKKDDGGVINTPSGREMLCGVQSNDELILSSIDCEQQIPDGMDAECVDVACSPVPNAHCVPMFLGYCNNGHCDRGKCIPN